jgi:DNA-binding MarR family transcriptional regulator
VKRSQAGKHLDAATWLTTSDQVVFLKLLERADNATCEMPHWFNPTIPELASKVHLGRSTVISAIKHLEHHGWLKVDRGNGRGRRSAYQLMPGDRERLDLCGPECPKRVQRLDRLSRLKGPTDDAKGSNRWTERVQRIIENRGLTSANPQGIAGTREGVVPEGSHEDFTQRLAALQSCHFCPSTDTQIIGAYWLCREHAGQGWMEGQCRDCHRAQQQWVLSERDGRCIPCDQDTRTKNAHAST